MTDDAFATPASRDPRRSASELWDIARAHYRDVKHSPRSSSESRARTESDVSEVIHRAAALASSARANRRRATTRSSAEFETLIRPILDRMPVKPERVSAIEGPLMQVTRIDDETLDVRMTTSFRAHFSSSLAGPGDRQMLALPNALEERGRFNDRDRDGETSASDGGWSGARGGVTISEVDAGEFVPGRGGRYAVMTPDDSWRTVVDDGDDGGSGGSGGGTGLRSTSPAIGWYDEDSAEMMRHEFTIKPEDVRLHERIAVGGFAEVFRGTWQGTVVAVKQLLERTKEVQAKLEQEVEVLAKLRHPNLLLFMGYCADPPLICTEFMRRGSLHTILKPGQVLDPARNYNVAIAVARGMAYLPSRTPPILHLDLKSPNILVDDKWRVKIADFGLARVRQTTQVSAKSDFHGTPEWMAPEMLRAENYDERADVYSFGVVLWELLTARTPWQELHPMQVVAVVGYSERKLELPAVVANAEHAITALITELFHSCASKSPADRPMFPVVLSRLELAKPRLRDASAPRPPPAKSSPLAPLSARARAMSDSSSDDERAPNLAVHLEFVPFPDVHRS